ncbi:MAG TPA: hypothetical protein DEQ09_08495 [Bacteroidales bacterium]|nr:hypothetical protein [Bacteroidales bacterium]
MTIFLREIASTLLSKYGESLAKHCIVFPNNRSILFFRKYLSELITRPLLIPSLHTISSLIKDRSSLKQAEPVQLVFELYNIYSEIAKRNELLDEFYYWGEMLVNDFDDIDKYLVDPELLFTNLADLKEIDQKFGGLDEEIIKIVKQFWINFDASNMTDEKTDFITVWEILSKIFMTFKRRLRSKGLAYEGMIIREQVEIVKSAPSEWYNDIEMFHFVGFNALNRCEKEILRELNKDGRAEFYWDYDPLYVNNPEHEAGHFIRQNIYEFPVNQEITVPGSSNSTINVYSTPSDVAQAKLIPSLVGDKEISDDPNETAVILADENLLTPVLNSLPSQISSINVTMGYPLFQTPVYSLVHQLLKMQKNKDYSDDGPTFYYNDVINILQHQYIAFNYPADSGSIIREIREKNIIRINTGSLQANKLFAMIFDEEFNNIEYLQGILSYIIDLFDRNLDAEEEGSTRLSLQQEYIYSLILPLNQLSYIIKDSEMDPGIDLYTRLIDRIMRKIVIPFSGEPLQGVQVMGILETRTLDFKNIIFLSANEGKIPRSPAGNSYIPYNLREAFGLPTIKHSDSIYAYYFYRLLHRAENVSFIYNSSTDGTRSGEMSRFLLQLKYDEKYNTSFKDTRFNILPSSKVKDIIVRTPDVNRSFKSLLIDDSSNKYLSPSAVNTWITCNMRFYYRYIAGIVETEDILDEVDSLAFGNILHQLMKDMYGPYTGKLLEESELSKILGDEKLIGDLAGRAFRKVFMKNSRGSIKGKNLVITSIIERMAKQIIKADMHYAPLALISTETRYRGKVSFNHNGIQKEARLEGTIDRVDRHGRIYRILDYKSGTDSLEIKDMDSLFDYDAKDRNNAAFQTLLYCELFMQNDKIADLRPSLYPVRKIFNDNFFDTFVIKKGEYKGSVESYSLIRDAFMDGLKKVITDIFDDNRPITMTSDIQKCRNCPYNSLCNRKS